MKDAYGSKNIYIACGYSDIKLILFDMGMKVMPGYTKHMFQNDLTKYLNSLILLLPYTYDFDVIKTLLEQYYPYECFIINEKYKYYCIKEECLRRHEKKSRFKMNSLCKLVKKLPIYRKIIDEKYVHHHQNQYNEEFRD